jgi:hypothetical protein
MTIERFPLVTALSNNSPPYSKAVRVNGFVFVSGQVGVNEVGSVVPGGIAAEARQTIENIAAKLPVGEFQPISHRDCGYEQPVPSESSEVPARCRR